MKILTVLGARPQFIKSAAISKKIINIDSLSEIVVHTGQHFEHNMSDIFFQEMNLPNPSYNLGINQMERESMIVRMVEELTPILVRENPDAVLVYGDTNSTLAGSLSANKLKIPIFHIEAGLRSFNKSMPEELNRIGTDQLSSLLFCPTKNSVNNLSQEKINEGVIFSGDVMFDIFLKFSQNLKNISNNRLNQIESDYILATIHRQENTDNKEKLRSIFSNLDKINNQLKIVMPLHPRTENKIKEFDINTNIDFLPPIGYTSMLSLLNNAESVITDSGGLQKEAYFCKKKCIIVREETEWVELIDSGVNILSDHKRIYESFDKIVAEECDFSKNHYGNGNAGELIINSILDF